MKSPLFGASWDHFGTTLVPIGGHLGPRWPLQGPLGGPNSAPEPPKVTPFGTKAHPKAPKVSQDAPQHLILDAFRSFGESF